MSRPRVEVRRLEPSDWPAIEALFGERGACGGCWCMAWRLPRPEWLAGKGASNKAAFRALVRSGRATGALAFATSATGASEPVGWCSVGPRSAFARLEAKRSLKTDWDASTWSVTCFFLRKDWRGKGLAKRLLECGVRIARDAGARRIEGYPVVPTSAAKHGKPMPAPFLWTGVPQVFERARFRPLPNPPAKRPIYVRALRPR